MPRKKTDTTIALEKIASKSGLGTKYLRELHRQGMPLSSTQAGLNWLASRPVQSPAASSVEALRIERIKLTRAQVAKAELELAIRRNAFISRTEHEESGVAIAQALRAMLAAYEKEIPSACFGKATLGEAQKQVREKSRALQQRLSDQQDEFWHNHPTA